MGPWEKFEGRTTVSEGRAAGYREKGGKPEKGTYSADFQKCPG